MSAKVDSKQNRTTSNVESRSAGVSECVCICIFLNHELITSVPFFFTNFSSGESKQHDEINAFGCVSSFEIKLRMPRRVASVDSWNGAGSRKCLSFSSTSIAGANQISGF